MSTLLSSSSSVEWERLAKLFLQGASFQALSLLSDKPQRLLHSVDAWVRHIRRACVRGASYILMSLSYTSMDSVSLILPSSLKPSLPEWGKRFLASLPGGYTTPGFFCSYVFVRAVHAQWLRGRVSDNVLWLFLAALMNHQLWAEAHHMPAAFQAVMVRGAGLDSFDSMLYRSRTRHIVPCDDATHGIHPGERSCVRAACKSLRRGVTELAAIYAALYLAQAVMGRFRPRAGARRGVPDFLSAYVRSVVMMATQMHLGRLAFCIQSQFFPRNFQYWLGPLVGFIASNGILLESPSARAEMVLFNAANILNTQLSVYGWHSSHVLALLFAFGSAQHNDRRFFVPSK